jgi:hypothetical protein
MTAGDSVGNLYFSNISVVPTGTTVASGNTGSAYSVPKPEYQPVFYNTSSGLLVFDTSSQQTHKTFVIDHPLDQNKYLVHGCLEGPEVGIYHRGKGQTEPGTLSSTIFLPEYVGVIATDFTIHLTAIGNHASLWATEVQHNQFTVYSDRPIRFHYMVYGKRKELEVEPSRQDVVVRGNGPYTWIETTRN